MKTDIFGDAANVNFHSNFQPKIGETDMVIKGPFTSIFVKVRHTWKIAHEHFLPLQTKENPA